MVIERCIRCGITATVVLAWDAGHPELGTVSLCSPCAETATSCRVCNSPMADAPCPRYRLVYETPVAVRGEVWAFCSDACETSEDAGQWKPEFCPGCDRDIPAYALFDGRSPQFVSQADGEWLCLRCAEREQAVKS